MIGHILRQDRDNHNNTAMTWAPEGKRKRGRPKTTWRRTVEKERREAGWKSWDEARVTAADRKRWRESVECHEALWSTSRHLAFHFEWTLQLLH